jgi:5-methylcytosine-specific restriction protein B
VTAFVVARRLRKSQQLRKRIVRPVFLATLQIDLRSEVESVKDSEFQTWLEARRWRGEPLTSKSIQNHRRRLKRVERSLTIMGYPDNDVDQVIARGEFPALLAQLNGFISAREGSGPPTSLVPQAENPDGQLRNLLAVTRLYGKFASGEDPNAHDLDVDEVEDDRDEVGNDADDIRVAALRLYINPARQKGQAEVSILASDLHDALGLDQAHANVCQALGGAKFQQMAKVPPPRVKGPRSSTTTTYIYSLGVGSISASEGAPLTATEPTNLILCGPPGTGKTYRTAVEAVRLCDGDIPYERINLMRRYGELVREGRIGFVTFHQSFSYEDFIEGLRPETATSEINGSAGFRLEPRKGVFREMAALADQARLAAAAPQRAGGLDLAGRRFWKMGLGAIGTEDHIYDEAIEGNYVVLGWGGDVDWSDPAYEDISAVSAKWAEVGPADSKPSNVSQLHPFRSEMKKGDIIIVPYGNTAFRAIGEVTGDYAFVQSGGGEYNHRRQVNWLLKLDKPLPLDSIVEGAFTMRTLYAINPRRIRIEAVSRLIGVASEAETSASGIPQAFVLIIDEINRANISKVFGELITLLEADKRLGMDNEIRVKLPYSGETFGVPANLHLIGTMNTADRSIALLDTALRRRFTFEEIMPEPDLLKTAARRTGVDLVAVLKVINERIEYLFDREHQVGHAFFMACKDRHDVDAVMRNRVIPLLQEYFFEDWSRLAMVLGEREGTGDGAFLNCDRITPPLGFDGETRWRWSVRPSFSPDAYQRLLGRAAASTADEETQGDAEADVAE